VTKELPAGREGGWDQSMELVSGLWFRTGEEFGDGCLVSMSEKVFCGKKYMERKKGELDSPST